MAKCYMCDAFATTKEHVPPKCLFPAQKDFPNGVDYRNQLITVPSCSAHNNMKSHDDEFLLYTLAMNLTSNTIAQNQYTRKIRRAIERNASLIDRIKLTSEPVLVQDIQTGEWVETLAYEVDHVRLCRVLEQIGRALFFHFYNEEWKSRVLVVPEFLLKMGVSNHKEINSQMSVGHKRVADLFNKEKFHGENPEVFMYQISKDPKGPECAMRLYFYEGCIVNILPNAD